MLQPWCLPTTATAPIAFALEIPRPSYEKILPVVIAKSSDHFPPPREKASILHASPTTAGATVVRISEETGTTVGDFSSPLKTRKRGFDVQEWEVAQ